MDDHYSKFEVEDLNNVKLHISRKKILADGSKSVKQCEKVPLIISLYTVLYINILPCATQSLNIKTKQNNPMEKSLVIFMICIKYYVVLTQQQIKHMLHLIQLQHITL